MKYFECRWKWSWFFL